MFKSGYSSATHKHADDLSFMLYSKGYEIFSDTGRYNYVTGNRYRDYFVSSGAHNTVIVDGRTYSTTSENATKTGILDYELGDDYDSVLAFNDMYNGVEIDRMFYSSGDLTLIHDDIASDTEHCYSQLFHLSEDMTVIEANDTEAVLKIANTGYIVRLLQLGGNTVLEKITGDFKAAEYGYISRELNQIESTTTLKFNITGTSEEFITLIAIEAPDGSIQTMSGSGITLDDIFYDGKNSTLSFGDTSLKLSTRERISAEKVSTDITDNVLSLKNNERNVSYAWYFIDASTGEVIKKTDWTGNPGYALELDEAPDVLFVKAYVKSPLGQCKSSVVCAAISDKDTGRYYIDDGSFYPYLNMVRNGQSYEQIDERTYKFHLDLDYSWNYSLRWYIYKDGMYYTVKDIKNSSDWTYEFSESGTYTISYYLKSSNGDKEYWNFRSIDIGLD